MRRIATAAASLAFAGGALLTAGGSANAAALPGYAHVPARTGAVVETGTAGGHHGQVRDCSMYDLFYLWIWEQLKAFGLAHP
ncbi:hypothetical protein ACFZDK_45455 [Streptomyces sp. NPDC007901]|uniref:hypothetical protein n=1 Tax=Streptomyces sp. NPDC007901 TaxID=3364785 RepID=UPI0036F028AA